MSAFDALLILSFGGPEQPADVLPFLQNVTKGRGIPDERLKEVAAHYDALGGKSPINDHCRALIRELRVALDAAGISLPIHWGNRNWHPMLPDAVRAMEREGIRRALVFTTSSFSSYSSCRQYLENLDAASEGTTVRLEKLRQHWNHPGFVAAVIARARETLATVEPERRAATRLVFTAHSIPNAMAATCRYADQLAEIAALVASELGIGGPVLAYQSRSGPPSVPWLEPDIRDALRALAADGARDVLVVPLGFTSDHVEVVWDLDHDAASLAKELGIGFHRAPTVGTHPAFVAMIVDLVRERLDARSERVVIGRGPAEPDRCAPDCCAYAPRRPSPA